MLSAHLTPFPLAPVNFSIYRCFFTFRQHFCRTGISLSLIRGRGGDLLRDELSRYLAAHGDEEGAARLPEVE